MTAGEREDFDEQVAYDEIDLYAELVIAAEASDGPLSQDEIDVALGLGESRGHAGRD